MDVLLTRRIWNIQPVYLLDRHVKLYTVYVKFVIFVVVLETQEFIP